MATYDTVDELRALAYYTSVHATTNQRQLAACIDAAVVARQCNDERLREADRQLLAAMMPTHGGEAYDIRNHTRTA